MAELSSNTAPAIITTPEPSVAGSSASSTLSYYIVESVSSADEITADSSADPASMWPADFIAERVNRLAALLKADLSEPE